MEGAIIVVSDGHVSASGSCGWNGVHTFWYSGQDIIGCDDRSHEKD